MEQPTGEDTPHPGDEDPGALLDAFRAHPEWDDRRRESQLSRLILRHPPDELRAELRWRLRDLSGADGSPVLRLVQALATPELLDGLARALLEQPHLPPERAWEALSLLEDAELLEQHPDLAERWDELNDALDDEGSLDQLAAQIEEDPEGLWLALQGLSAVEPEVRAEIIRGLSDQEPGPNLVEFLRLLCYCHDPATRSAALDALGRAGWDDRDRLEAWASLAGDHPDRDVATRALDWLGHAGRVGETRPAKPPREAPRLLHSLVAAVDGRGQATIVLSAAKGGAHTTAAFLCDVRRGIPEVFGQVGPTPAGAEESLASFAGEPDRAAVHDNHALAEALLRGCLLLCGPDTTPALQYWLEATIGPGVTPHTFPIPFPGWDPATLVPEEMAGRSRLVLERCPTWVDTSDLTHDLAEEILLRDRQRPPDPRRDAGAYRYLFEHQIRGQLELYRRMLYWMASFWQAEGDHELGRSALALATQLSDEQHAVAGHPFTVALTTRSLAQALANLRDGDDPRRRPRSTGA